VLVDRARAEAAADGVSVLRVDCWAGSPRLVGWYEEHGFERTETFSVKVTLDEGEGDVEWIGQVLQMDWSGGPPDKPGPRMDVVPGARAARRNRADLRIRRREVLQSGWR
jgi:hypothetical protein